MMPQLFQVLKCYKCSVFQVHQTKKSNKWGCKMCGEKQSLKRHYGLGTGKECRLHVQKLNGIRGEIDEQNVSIELYRSSDEELENNSSEIKKETLVERNISNKSKWSNFIDEMEPSQPEENENMYLGNTKVVLEAPVKKRKKFIPPTATDESTNLPSHESNESAYNYNSNEYLCSSKSKYAFNTNTFVRSNKIKTDTEIFINVSNAENHVANKKVTETLNVQDENHKKTYIPPKVNTDSKWAEFADESDEIGSNITEENTPDRKFVENTFQSEDKLKGNVIQSLSNSVENVFEIKDKSTKNIYPSRENVTLFSLCDENELDDILEF